MFRGLESRWHKSILLGGDYFKGDKFDLDQ